MTQSAQDVWRDVAWIVLGAAVLIAFAVAAVWPHRASTRPGSSGHRPIDGQGEHEVIRPDGYIDSFAGQISEGGGGLPTLLKIALPGVILWWLLYLILNWTWQ